MSRRPGPDGLTDRQRGVFAALYEHAREHGYQPSTRELMAVIGVRSPNSMAGHLRALAVKGWLEPTPESPRALKFRRRPDGRPFTGFLDPPSEPGPPRPGPLPGQLDLF